ncbi:hypothetical protein EMCG_09123 [[Emmonsia] crescens]|uniref:Uncharacterized protein n=1 Tax=[Emmonsia] crescens TaxID=73230 RepID=A0A0G2I3M7_9EURO|nr:hypothetical protein EMCG_09123 [Emmonsia crescens UAMH 3008]
MTVTLISQKAQNQGKLGLCADSVDIVAVHGLDENGTTAWTHPETGCFWLRSLLPDENFESRILTFDYKADATSFFGSSSSDRILHHAQTLLEEVNAERELDDSTERPIIFVCHGLGGIIVKKALAISSASTSAKLTHLHSIATSTFGLIFFGTPHEGVEKAKWYLLSRGLKGILKNQSQLVAAIEKNAETLQNVTEQFTPLLKQFYIHNFWETLETTRGMSKGYIVSSRSAAPAWEDTGRSGLPSTHSKMCKFSDRNDTGYRMIRGILQRYVAKAGPVISARSEKAKQYLQSRRQYEASEILTFNIHNDNKLLHIECQAVKDNRNQHYVVPFAASESYTGREQLARGLQERMLAPNDQQKRFVLYGLGGSGKTQFCLKFAWDNRDSFWGVFWVDASSSETAKQAFSELARLGRMEEKFESGMYWLSAQAMPWLLVIDNADDAEFDYARYFPPGGKGHILVTSRNPDCKVHATIGFEEFKSLEEEDAITLLLRTSFIQNIHDRSARDSARPIVKALGCLPLALIQAGASIRQNICSLEDYLSLFDSYKDRIFINEFHQGRGSYEHTIFTTFELSFNKIKSLKTDEAIDAIEILHVMAFLHFDQVPQTIFEKVWESLRNHGKLKQPVSFVDEIVRALGDLVTLSSGYGGWLTPLAEGRLPRILTQDGNRWDKLRFRNAILILRSYSLIFSNRSLDSYSMHPMVHFWARERLLPRAQKLWGGITSRILAEAVTSKTDESEVVYRRLLMPHIDSCLKTEPHDSRHGLRLDHTNMNQFARFATVYAEGGRWNDAAVIQEQLLKNRINFLGQDSFEAFDVMADLARSYWNSSQLPKALHAQTTLLSLTEQKLGPHDPRTLQAMDSLGSTLWLCGKTSKADELGKRSLEGLTNIVGSDHPFTLSAMHNFARARMHLGHIKEAQKLQIKAWQGRSRFYGDTKLETMETMQDLGMSCLALGEVDEAERLVSHVLDARKRILGQEHAHTLWSINDLSKVYCAQGYPKDAVALLIPTREISTRTLGESHIGTFMTNFNLAHAYRISEQLQEAEDILSDLIKAEIKVLGRTHVDVFGAEMELAQVYKQSGNRTRAEKLFHETFSASSKALGLRHFRTLQAKKHLCTIYRESGRLDEAALLEFNPTGDKVNESLQQVQDQTSKQPRRSSTV